LSDVTGAGQAVGDVGAAAINAASQQATATSEEQAASNLQQSAFKDQTGYDANQQQAARDALLGIAGQGNAYGQALTSVAKPNMAQSPSFGGGVYSGAANTGTMQPGSGSSGVSAGMTDGSSSPYTTKANVGGTPNIAGQYGSWGSGTNGSLGNIGPVKRGG
jgi:hypothetical protein